MNNAFCCCLSPSQESNEIATNMPEVQSMQQVEDLIAYIDQLMNTTGGQQQAPRRESVAAFIDCGRNLLENLSKRLNWHVSKKCLLSALHRETRNAVFQVVNQAQLIPYLGMALSVIAHVCERAEQASSNKDKCLGLLREMSILARHMKNLEIHLHDKLDDILVFIVKGSLICARQMETHSICRFIFAPLDAADLENLRADLERSYPDLEVKALTEILNRLPATPGPSQPGQYPTNAVGMVEVENKVINLLDLTDELSRKVVVIYGVGGIGKTTLATKVLSRLRLTGYEYCRVDMEQDPKTSDLLRMQKQILRELFKKKMKLENCTQGREELWKAFAQPSHPVFLFMDNVLKERDLSMLLPIEQLSMLPMSSRIFVTTRDLNEINILRCWGGFEVCSYNVAPLLEPEAKRLLCHHALGDETGSFNPGVDMGGLLRICGGIPLVLRIVGSKIRAEGNTVSACNAILEYFEKWINNGMEGGEESEIIVDFVYKGFKEASKEAFLDVVFFFNGCERSRVAEIVGEVELQDLERTALVTASQQQGRVKIHDIVLARGRRLSEGNRITEREELLDLLSDEEKLKQTKGIWFPRISRWDELYVEDCMMMIEAKQVDLMSRSLRVLSLGNEIRINGRCQRPFEDLMFLDISYEDLLPIDLSKSRQLVYFTSSSMKGNGFPQLPQSLRLVHLDLNGCSMLERIPEGFGNLSSLKILKITGCSNLKRLPESFGNISSLRELEMNDCSNLKRLSENFGNISSMVNMTLCGCSMLESLPESFGSLSSLQELNMTGCSMLESLPESFGSLSSLQELNMTDCSMLERIPESFGNLSSLQKLNMTDLSKLERLPESFEKLSSMLQLDLNGCSMLERLPESFGNLSSLQELNMNNCSKLERLPESFGNLSSLRELKMRSCERLEIIGNLSSIEVLDLYGGSILERLPESFGNLSSLRLLKMNGFSKLGRFPESFGKLSSMEQLELIGCSIPESFGYLPSLKGFKVHDCSKLQLLPQTFDQLTSLQTLEIYGGESAEKTCDIFCNIGRLKCLKFLSIRNCKEVKTLPDDIKCCTSLAAVKAYGCPELDAKAMDNLVEMKSLMFLEIGESPMLIKRWKEIQQEDRPLIGAVLRFEDSINTWREIMSTMFFSAGSRFVEVDGDGKLAASSFPDVGVEVCLLFTPWGLQDEVREEMLEVTSQLQIIYVDVDVDYMDVEEEGSGWMEKRDMRIREMLLQLPEGSRAWTSPFYKTSLLFAYSLSEISNPGSWSWSLGYTYASVVGTSVLVDEEGRKQLSPSKMIFRRDGFCDFSPLHELWRWML